MPEVGLPPEGKAPEAGLLAEGEVPIGWMPLDVLPGMFSDPAVLVPLIPARPARVDGAVPG